MSRQLYPVKDTTTTFYRVEFEDNGPLPKDLEGLFTTQQLALNAIAIWRTKQKERPAEEKLDSEKDIMELLETKRKPGRPSNASKR